MLVCTRLPHEGNTNQGNRSSSHYEMEIKLVPPGFFLKMLSIPPIVREANTANLDPTVGCRDHVGPSYANFYVPTLIPRALKFSATSLPSSITPCLLPILVIPPCTTLSVCIMTGDQRSMSISQFTQ
jgi:hypothetical protein